MSLDEQLQRLAEDKAKSKQTIKKVSMLCYPLAAVLVICMLYFSWGGFMYIILGMVIGIPSLTKNSIKNTMVGNFKHQIVNIALSEQRPELSYFPGMCIPEESFVNSNLFGDPDRFGGEDLIEGAHEKTTFSFSEVHAEREVKSKNGSSYITIFKGLFMVADFNKYIKNETYVLTSGRKIFSKFKRVKLENPVFDKNFKVYSDSQIEARYILTPSIMDKIIALENSFNAQLYVSFKGCNVYIALKTRDNYFEPNLEGEITKEVLNEVMGEIDACISIIDELGLNTRIWTKE